MGDSTAMTIEFLRARLLSERSVSRAARQRADQLSKRVMELEEQLRLVTIQRKKAEKAAEEVLSILDSQGIGDLSDTINSSSDQEELLCDDTAKEYESSTTSRMERSEVDDGLSGSEPEVSNSQGRNLSWKSCSNSPDSHEKQRAKQIKQRQRRRSFKLTLESSPKHQLGLSCRKIKRKDMQYDVDSETNKPTLLDAQGNGEITRFDYCNNQFKGYTQASKGMEEAGADSSQGDDHSSQTEICHYANGRERDEVMERILEKQAKLIGQFQAEENAQREWEDKYNENKTTLTSLLNVPGMPNMLSGMPFLGTTRHDMKADFKLGSQSCMDENSRQTKTKITEFADRTPDNDQEANLRHGHISNSEEPTSKSLSSSENNDGSKTTSNIALSNGSTPRDIISAPIRSCSDAHGKDLVGHQHDGMTIQETKTISPDRAVLAPECYGVLMNGKQNEVMLHNVCEGHYPSHLKLHSHGIGSGILEDPSSTTNFHVDNQNKLQKLPQQRNLMQLGRQLPQTTSSNLGGVLEALQRAKLSLSQELGKLPSPSQNTLAIAAPSQTRAVTSVSGLGIPISSASLFRLPTDSFPPSHFSGPKFYCSQPTYPANLSDVACETSPHGHANPSTNSFVQGGSRVILGTEYRFDNHINSNIGISDTNRYFRASSAVPAERVSFHNEFSKSYSDARNGMPFGDRYSLYNGDRTRSAMRML